MYRGLKYSYKEGERQTNVLERRYTGNEGLYKNIPRAPMIGQRGAHVLSTLNLGVFQNLHVFIMEKNKQCRENSTSGASEWKFNNFCKDQQRVQSKTLRDKTFFLGLNHPFFTGLKHKFFD